ncbi:MATE family efflux transporter [Hydrogeniiclostridium mannosilyticum]|uniref:MATE family efflux transporter n=1 Tax=Hydrogeniiclostridium mannosilyticum TaxID=2764322 RepID=UPI0039B8BE32
MSHNPLKKADNRAFYKTVVALVLPMALQNLINVGVSSADVIMLGQVGETVLSAASLAGQVQFIMTLVFFGLTSGAAVLTAQYWGKGDTRTIEKVMGIAMRFSLMVGLAFTLAAWLIPEVLMSIYTSEPEVISEGCKYLRIVAVAYIPISITTIYLNIMRSVERVVISTVVYLISLVTNVILNAVFIFGLLGLPAMGIMGAALATMIARFVELAIVLFYSKKMNRTIRFRISDLFVRDGFLFRDFLRYSIPVVLNELMWGAGASMNSAVIGHLGSAATAANSVAQVTRQLATVVAFGIANAAAIMIGKAIGAGDVARAKNYGARFTKLTLLAGVAGAVVVLIVRPIVMASMTLSPEAEGYLSMMMLVMSYFVIGQAYNTTMVVGVFRAGGDTRFGLALDVISMWCCSILLGAIAAFVLKWSVPVVYIILMSDEVLKVPFTTWRYKTRVWLKNVTR